MSATVAETMHAAHADRRAAIVARFTAAGYPAADCTLGPSERIIDAWLKAGVTPAILDRLIAELRIGERSRPHFPGLPTRLPVVALERLVLAECERAAWRAGQEPTDAAVAAGETM